MELLLQALRITLPYLLATLGGAFSERAGVVNIALEGMMLVGGFGTVLGTLVTGNPWLGLLTGVLAGALLGGVHALATGYFRADHIVSGLALNLLAAGGTRFLLQRLYESSSNSPRIDAVESLGSGSMSLFLHPLFWLTGLLLAGTVWFFQRSVLGLRLSAVGESPEAATAAGLPVLQLRTLGVVCSGALAGLAGVWLAFDQHKFVDGMSGGRGYIALAALIIGRWRPLPAALACLLFGVAETVQIALQGTDSGIPSQLIQTLPYLLTVVVLVTAVGRSRAPAALGRSL
jgi:simple sugar transport system permease protein